MHRGWEDDGVRVKLAVGGRGEGPVGDDLLPSRLWSSAEQMIIVIYY